MHKRVAVSAPRGGGTCRLALGDSDDGPSCERSRCRVPWRAPAKLRASSTITNSNASQLQLNLNLIPASGLPWAAPILRLHASSRLVSAAPRHTHHLFETAQHGQRPHLHLHPPRCSQHSSSPRLTAVPVGPELGGHSDAARCTLRLLDSSPQSSRYLVEADRLLLGRARSVQDSPERYERAPFYALRRAAAPATTNFLYLT